MASEIIPSGVYFIQNVGTGTVMDLQNGTEADGITPTLGTQALCYEKRLLLDRAVSSQLWILVQSGANNVFTIQNARTTTFMDILSGNFPNGAPIIVNPKSTNISQTWKITRNSNKTAYVIQNMLNSANYGTSSGFADLSQGGQANETPVNGLNGDGYDGSGVAITTNSQQLWRVVPAI